jgi:ribosomal protein S18 acetylase RimI-like enzyme
VEDLAAAADRLQDGLRHRRIEVEDEAAGARLRPGFQRLGWKTTRLVWLSLSTPPAGPDFEEVPVELTRALRLDWARSEGLEISEREFLRQADAEEDVARRRGVRALVERGADGEPIGYVLFLTDGEGVPNGTSLQTEWPVGRGPHRIAEVEQAYVQPALRGRGTGGALVAAAARAGGASETFIVADDEGDPKRLYMRLGFRPVWIQYEFTRRPSATLA